MSKARYQHPRIKTTMRKARVEILVTRKTSAEVRFERLTLEGATYQGTVYLTLTPCGFCANVAGHQHSIERVVNGGKTRLSRRAPRETICREAVALVNELHRTRPEVFLDADVAHAADCLAVAKSARKDGWASRETVEANIRRQAEVLAAAIERRDAVRAA